MDIHAEQQEGEEVAALTADEVQVGSLLFVSSPAERMVASCSCCTAVREALLVVGQQQSWKGEARRTSRQGVVKAIGIPGAFRVSCQEPLFADLQLVSGISRFANSSPPSLPGLAFDAFIFLN